MDECFRLLTEYLEKKMQIADGTLEEYFLVRAGFFREYPVYQRLFCEANINLPVHLYAKIQNCRHSFDALNIQILEHLLASADLRPQICRNEVIDIFRQFQDFINTKYQENDFESHEKNCKKILNVLLYGVIDRKEQNYV